MAPSHIATMKLHGASSLASFILTSTLLVPHALANVEKVIFKAPGQEKAVFDAPGTDDVSQHTLRRAAWYLADLPKLTHTNFTLNADIEAGFPNASFPDGPATWMLLEDLNPGQRYEARVSWPATVRERHLSLPLWLVLHDHHEMAETVLV